MKTTAAEDGMQAALRRDVTTLATTIGERNTKRYKSLCAAADFVTSSLRAAGYAPRRQEYEAEGRTVANIEAELAGTTRAGEIVAIGAHYDSAEGTPAANDNGSGVAAMLAIARAMSGAKPARTVRFVAFVNEEPNFYHTDLMGSVVYAKRCRQRRENIAAMLSLETIGYYSDEADSQRYPHDALRLLFPNAGNFIGFVSNLESQALLDQAHALFRAASDFPIEKVALPEAVEGVGYSDHWSFWQEGYQAIMVTDTAHMRYPHYHTADDTPDKIDFARMTRVVEGLVAVARGLSAAE
jgi:Zn-dependent M28 family amino/carboxypeptidase